MRGGRDLQTPKSLIKTNVTCIQCFYFLICFYLVVKTRSAQISILAPKLVFQQFLQRQTKYIQHPEQDIFSQEGKKSQQLRDLPFSFFVFFPISLQLLCTRPSHNNCISQSEQTRYTSTTFGNYCTFLSALKPNFWFFFQCY